MQLGDHLGAGPQPRHRLTATRQRLRSGLPTVVGRPQRARTVVEAHPGRARQALRDRRRVGLGDGPDVPGVRIARLQDHRRAAAAPTLQIHPTTADVDQAREIPRRGRAGRRAARVRGRRRHPARRGDQHQPEHHHQQHPDAGSPADSNQPGPSQRHPLSVAEEPRLRKVVRRGGVHLRSRALCPTKHTKVCRYDRPGTVIVEKPVDQAHRSLDARGQFRTIDQPAARAQSGLPRIDGTAPMIPGSWRSPPRYPRRSMRRDVHRGEHPPGLGARHANPAATAGTPARRVRDRRRLRWQPRRTRRSIPCVGARSSQSRQNGGQRRATQPARDGAGHHRLDRVAAAGTGPHRRLQRRRRRSTAGRARPARSRRAAGLDQRRVPPRGLDHQARSRLHRRLPGRDGRTVRRAVT